jgi:hypothetical protein
MSLVLFGLLWATAQGQAAALINFLLAGNNAAFGGGPIATTGIVAPNTVSLSFIPNGANGSNNGRGALVLGNKLYYTELQGGFGPTNHIRAAPFNDGAGGSDNATWTLSNPRPGCGVQGLAYHDGYIYALTGYGTCPSPSPSRIASLQVFKIPVGGNKWSAPVTIGGSDASADGFTILVNNGAVTFLINDGDASCTYREYYSTTGVATGNSFTVPADQTTAGCRGVDTADVDTPTPFLFISRGNQLSIALLTTTPSWSLAVDPPLSLGDGWLDVEDISLVHGFVGTAGTSDCHTLTDTDLKQRYGSLANAASALGYPSQGALDADIIVFCGN